MWHQDLWNVFYLFERTIFSTVIYCLPGNISYSACRIPLIFQLDLSFVDCLNFCFLWSGRRRISKISWLARIWSSNAASWRKIWGIFSHCVTLKYVCLLRSCLAFFFLFFGKKNGTGAWQIIFFFLLLLSSLFQLGWYSFSCSSVYGWGRFTSVNGFTLLCNVNLENCVSSVVSDGNTYTVCPKR